MDESWISYTPHVKHHGMLAALMYLAFAVLLVISSSFLDQIGGKDVKLGLTVNGLTENQWHLPARFKIQSGGVLSDPYQTNVTKRGTSDVLWMSCVENKLPNCTAVMEQQTNTVFIAIGRHFAQVQEIIKQYPQLNDFSKIKYKYMTNVDAFNYPVFKYYAEDADDAITCIIRRARYSVGGTGVNNANPPSSFAFCSIVWNDPDFLCENEAPPQAATYVFLMENGVVSYLGNAPRSEFYLNAGNHALLSGSPSGQGIISPVVATDEYQGGYVVARAPWDIVAAMDCTTYNPETGRGWLWKGEGRVTMVWKAGPAIVVNSLVLLTIIFFMTCIQFKYLRFSGIAVAPIYLSKTIIGAAILILVHYGNYNDQVLSLFLKHAVGKSEEINLLFYESLGPVGVASINGIMIGVAVQSLFNPRVVSPPKLVTAIAIVTWFATFAMELWILPSSGATTRVECTGTGGTACVEFDAAMQNYIISIVAPLILLLVVALAVKIITMQRSKKYRIRALSNSVTVLFGLADVKFLVTDIPSVCEISCDHESGTVLFIDPGVLLQKNLVRITDTRIVRFTSMKYAFLCQIIPGFERCFSSFVGSILSFHCDGNRVDHCFTYEELIQLDLKQTGKCSYYLS